MKKTLISEDVNSDTDRSLYLSKRLRSELINLKLRENRSRPSKLFRFYNVYQFYYNCVYLALCLFTVEK